MASLPNISTDEDCPQLLSTLTGEHLGRLFEYEVADLEIQMSMQCTFDGVGYPCYRHHQHKDDDGDKALLSLEEHVSSAAATWWTDGLRAIEDFDWPIKDEAFGIGSVFKEQQKLDELNRSIDEHCRTDPLATMDRSENTSTHELQPQIIVEASSDTSFSTMESSGFSGVDPDAIQSSIGIQDHPMSSVEDSSPLPNTMNDHQMIVEQILPPTPCLSIADGLQESACLGQVEPKVDEDHESLPPNFFVRSMEGIHTSDGIAKTLNAEAPEGGESGELMNPGAPLKSCAVQHEVETKLCDQKSSAIIHKATIVDMGTTESQSRKRSRSVSFEVGGLMVGSDLPASKKQRCATFTSSHAFSGARSSMKSEERESDVEVESSNAALLEYTVEALPSSNVTEELHSRNHEVEKLSTPQHAQIPFISSVDLKIGSKEEIQEPDYEQGGVGEDRHRNRIEEAPFGTTFMSQTVNPRNSPLPKHEVLPLETSDPRRLTRMQDERRTPERSVDEMQMKSTPARSTSKSARAVKVLIIQDKSPNRRRDVKKEPVQADTAPPSPSSASSPLSSPQVSDAEEQTPRPLSPQAQPSTTLPEHAYKPMSKHPLELTYGKRQTRSDTSTTQSSSATASSTSKDADAPTAATSSTQPSKPPPPPRNKYGFTARKPAQAPGPKKPKIGALKTKPPARGKLLERKKKKEEEEEKEEGKRQERVDVDTGDEDAGHVPERQTRRKSAQDAELRRAAERDGSVRLRLRARGR
ncbi:hypothetical protein ACN47E_007411 [Coniothyrium glycines]